MIGYIRDAYNKQPLNRFQFISHLAEAFVNANNGTVLTDDTFETFIVNKLH